MITPVPIKPTLSKFRIPDKLKSHLGKSPRNWEWYIFLAFRELLKAYSKFRQGFRNEACEAAWSAFVFILKALSVKLWGFTIRTHRGLCIFIDWLCDENVITDCDKIRTGLGIAEALHSNFYDLEATERQIKFWIDKVKDIVQYIDAVIEGVSVEKIIIIPEVPQIKELKLRIPILR